MQKSSKHTNTSWYVRVGLALGLALGATGVMATGGRTAAADSDKRDTGAHCESSYECKSSNCDRNVCKSYSSEKRETGAQCESSFECKSSNCDHNVCKSYGNEKRGKGMQCDSSYECQSSDCTNHYCR
jgi:hypothetical protein